MREADLASELTQASIGERGRQELQLHTNRLSDAGPDAGLGPTARLLSGDDLCGLSGGSQLRQRSSLVPLLFPVGKTVTGMLTSPEILRLDLHDQLSAVGERCDSSD